MTINTKLFEISKRLSILPQEKSIYFQCHSLVLLNPALTKSENKNGRSPSGLLQGFLYVCIILIRCQLLSGRVGHAASLLNHSIL